MTGRLRAVGAAFVAVLVTAGLTGCVTLPDNSAVQSGRGSGVHGRGHSILYTPNGPSPGAGKQGIVNGYLQAMLGFPQSPAKVREFLTPGARPTWQPNQTLIVYDGAQVRPGPEGTVELDVHQLGTVDSRGSWVTSSAAGNTLKISLVLTKVDGQWRISNPPGGTLLASYAFERYYHEYSLYFFDPTHTMLAPDPVYELTDSSNRTATALVRNLLLGPTAAMGGVVSGVVPGSTRLAGGVEVSTSGLADIRLTRQVLALSPPDLQLFAAQLSWTLRQARLSISRARLLVGGRAVDLPGIGESFPIGKFNSFNPSGFPVPQNFYALSGGKLRSVSPVTTPAGIVYQVSGAIGSFQGTASVAAVSVDLSRAALVVDSSTAVEVGSLEPGDAAPADSARWFHQGTHLLKPSWDGHGLLWFVDRTDSGAVVRVATSRDNVRVVEAPGISGEHVQGFAVSRDGTRLAAIVRQGGPRSRSTLMIAMVRRSATVPLHVTVLAATPVLNVAFSHANLSSVSWYSPTVLAVLARIAGGEAQPYEITVDGSRVKPTGGFLPGQLTNLTAAADPTIPPVVGTASGDLYIRAAEQRWPAVKTRRAVRLRSPTYPG